MKSEENQVLTVVKEVHMKESGNINLGFQPQ